MNFYESIDELPIYNWLKCIDKKDYTYCLKKIKPCSKNDLAKCEEKFNSFYYEFLDRYGINDKLSDIIELKNEILINEIELAITGDRFINTIIQLKKEELEKLIEQKVIKTNSSKIAIEKYLGFRINEKEITVVEYYDYLKEIEENVRTTT